MIDPLAAVIQYLKRSSLSVKQIAGKHRYGESWPAGSRGIVVRLDGGAPNLYVAIQAVRLEMRFYAESEQYAMQVLGEMVALSRATEREAAAVGGDTALIYNLAQASGASLLYDEDINMPFALMFFEAMVAESPI